MHDITIGDPYSPDLPELSTLYAWKDPAQPAEFAEGYANQREGESDEGAAYGCAVFIFAARWARAMENALGDKPAESVTQDDVAGVADAAMKLADATEGMGITGHMYGRAVAVLAATWLHGEHLRRWHNDQYNPAANERAGAVVNPAIVIVAIPDA